MFDRYARAEGHELLPGVILRTLAHGEQTLLAEVRIARGAVIPEHRHPQEQTGYLVSGRLEFSIEGVELIAEPGSSWSLPADISHGASALTDSVVIEVFSPVREDYLPAPARRGGEPGALERE
jgi:quercetin dioxygenase-like cupin family protein